MRAISQGAPSVLPRLAGTAERHEGGPGVAFGQVDLAAGVVRHRAERAAALTLRDVLEVAAGAARLLEVAERRA